MRYLLKLKEKEEEFLSKIMIGGDNIIDNLDYIIHAFRGRGETHSELRDESLESFKEYLSLLYEGEELANPEENYIDSVCALYPNVERGIIEENLVDYSAPVLWKAIVLVGFNDPSVVASRYKLMDIERGEIYSAVDINDDDAFDLENDMREEGHTLADYVDSQMKKLSSGYSLLKSSYENWEKDQDNPTLISIFNGASTLMSLLDDDWKPMFLPYDAEAIKGALNE